MLKINAAPGSNPSPAIAGPYRPTENKGAFSQLMADNKRLQQAMQAQTQTPAPAPAPEPLPVPESAAPAHGGGPNVDPAAAQAPRIEEPTAGNAKANAATYASQGSAAHIPAPISDAVGNAHLVKLPKTDPRPPETRTVDATSPDSDLHRPHPSEKSGTVDTAGAAAPAPAPDPAAWVAALTPAASPEANAETRAATIPTGLGTSPAALDRAQVGVAASTGLQVGSPLGSQMPGRAENLAAGVIAGETHAVREQQAAAPADAVASALQSGQPVSTQFSGPGTASATDTSALVAHSAAWMAAPVATALPEALSVQVATATHAPEFREALGVQVSLLARDGVQSAELHLNPAEMGPISVRIVMDGAQARVDFGADSAATRELIETGLPELATALRDAGFTLAGGGVSQHPPGSQDRSQDASDNRSGAGTDASRSARRIADSLADDHRAPVGLRMRLPNSAVDLYA